MRRILGILLFFFSTLAFGQTQEIDSLKSILRTVKDDRAKIDLLNQIAKLYQFHSLTELERYASEAVSLSEKTGYEKGRADALMLLGIYNTYRAYHDLALEQQLQSLQIFERLEDKPSLAKTLHNIGGLYFYLREYEKAIDFLSRSIVIKRVLGDTLNTGLSDMSLCVCYNYMNQPDKGKLYCEEALTIMKQYNKPERLAEAYLYIAQNLRLRKRFGEAAHTYQQAVALVESRHYQSTGVELYNDLGMYYQDIQKYDSAAYYLHRTLRLLRNFDDQSSLIHSYELLSKNHELMHQYDSALFYFKLYSNVNNDHFNSEKSRQIASLQAKYDLKNKDKELELNRQRLHTQRYVIIAISIILFITMILGYAIFRIYLSKKKANEKLQVLYNTIREKSEEILAQSEKLQIANDEIRRMNENLESIVEERTAKVAIQNKKLIEFAYFNAHKVRGPLARILGLVQLTRLSKFQSEIEHIHTHLETSAQQLDEVIHEINSKLEEEV